jgi:SfnB family sulfur acquisition oxidoreductase
VPAHRITSDAEAIEVAHRLAEGFRPGAGERDRDRVLPVAELEALSASGLGGITIPRRWGGADVSNVTLAEVTAILAAADASIGQLPQNQFAFLRILAGIDRAPVQAWIYAKALDGHRFSSAQAEAASKSTKEVTARSRRDGDGHIISGRKGYGTSALFAHYVGVQVLNEEGRGTRAVIPNTAPGLMVIDDWSSFGQRTTASGTILMNDVRVPDDHVFDTQILSERPVLSGSVSQLIQAAIDQGIAREALSETVAFVRSRSRPWIDSGVERASDDPYTIAAVGDLAIRVHAADAMLRRAGEVLDATAAEPSEETVAAASIAVAEAKVLTTEAAMLTTNKLFELAGTRSTLREFMLDRHWRNARVHTLHDPVRWKYAIVGNYHLNGTPPPRHGWI